MKQATFAVILAIASIGSAVASPMSEALLHKSAIGQGIPNPKKIYAAATVWGVPRSVN